MSNPKRKVTDLLPSEAILISCDAERDAVLDLMDDAGMKWATGDKPSEWKSKRPYPYCIFTYDLYKTCTLCLSTLNEAKNERSTIYFATDFIPIESDEVEEGSTIESVFKLAKWILENRVSSIIDADIPQEDKDRLARHFGYSADLTNP